MRRAYSRDLAYIHHEGFSAFIQRAKAHLLKLMKPRMKPVRHGRTPLVVDLGCGSGVWARELVRAGYDVVGIDISEAMIRLARKNAPGARFIKASFGNSQFPACEVVTALGEVINYSFDPSVTRRELRRFFARVHAALAPGGLFIFDVAGPGRAGPTGVREGSSQGKDWAILFRVEEHRTGSSRGPLPPSAGSGSSTDVAGRCTHRDCIRSRKLPINCGKLDSRYADCEDMGGRDSPQVRRGLSQLSQVFGEHSVRYLETMSHLIR